MSIQYVDRMLWPNGRKKAFTLSYDDGVLQDLRLVEILDKYKVKATFNLNPGLFGNKGSVAAGKKEVPCHKLEGKDIAKVYKNHEIAGHGFIHCSLTGMDSARCSHEILQSRLALEEILKKPVTGMAYAFGTYDESVLKTMRTCKIAYSRTVKSTGDFALPKDFLKWHPTCHHNDIALGELTQKFLSDDVYFHMKTPAKLFYVWGHSYEFDQDENWEQMETFIKDIAGREDVWYATNGEICDYVKAFEQLVFSVDGNYVYNPTAMTLYMGGVFTSEFLEIGSGQTVRMLPGIEI